MKAPCSRPMHNKARLAITTKLKTTHAMNYDSVVFHANWVQVNHGDQSTWFPVGDIIHICEYAHLPSVTIEGKDQS
jgi:hypothetical protein